MAGEEKERKLSTDQHRVLAEFLANLGVTWFAGGVVAPIFTNRQLTDIIPPAIWGLSLAMLSLGFSLWSAKGGK